MPYKMDVVIPRITPATIAELESKVPGLSGLVKIPLVRFPEDAMKVAETTTNKNLPRYEYVSGVEGITETTTGWVVALRISGD